MVEAAYLRSLLFFRRLQLPIAGGGYTLKWVPSWRVHSLH
jgi:hypothetical protein